jgi:lambda repressor-like predicted transcriptional regulator
MRTITRISVHRYLYIDTEKTRLPGLIQSRGIEMTEVRKWDRHAIKAEVHRRGLTLTGIARDAGLYDCACSQGINGGSLAGAQALAKAIGVPVEELFPDRYVSSRSTHPNRNQILTGSASQNARDRADRARAA